MNICYSPPGIRVAVHENRAMYQLFFLSFHSTACLKKSSFNEVDLDKSEKQ